MNRSPSPPEATTGAARSVRGALAEQVKMGRYAYSFLRKGLVHTNLQLLYQCNFRCQICEFWKPEYKERPRLSLEQVSVISHKLARIGPQIVSIGGGEPLMHPEVEGIVEVLSAQHFPVMICNGWFVTPDIARRLFAAGIYEISISVDYADPERHDAQRGVKGAFDRAISALRTLQEQRVYPWQRVHMISVVMDDNLSDIERLIQLCGEMGITYLVTLYSDGRGVGACRASRSDVTRELLRLKDKYPDFVQLRGYIARFSEAIEHHGIGPCKAGKNLCNIDCQGNVTLCIDRLDEPVGNILHDDVKLLERRLLDKHKANECRDCWTSCRGSIETLMYGGGRLGNLLDYHRMTRQLPLTLPKASDA